MKKNIALLLSIASINVGTLVQSMESSTLAPASLSLECINTRLFLQNGKDLTLSLPIKDDIKLRLPLEHSLNSLQNYINHNFMEGNAIQEYSNSFYWQPLVASSLPEILKELPGAHLISLNDLSAIYPNVIIGFGFFKKTIILKEKNNKLQENLNLQKTADYLLLSPEQRASVEQDILKLETEINWINLNHKALEDSHYKKYVTKLTQLQESEIASFSQIIKLVYKKMLETQIKAFGDHEAKFTEKVLRLSSTKAIARSLSSSGPINDNEQDKKNDKSSDQEKHKSKRQKTIH